MPLAPALDGNTVDGQLEQAAFAENTVRYQATLSFISSKFRGADDGDHRAVTTMSSFKIFDIAGSGMSAQSVRLNTTASNLANADSVSGDPNQVYKAKHPLFEAIRASLGANAASSRRRRERHRREPGRADGALRAGQSARGRRTATSTRRT